MMYSAIGVAVIGTATGLAFRWKVLLPVIALVPIAAVIFSVYRGLDAKDAAIVVVVTEAVLQGGYFFGLLIRLIATAGMRFVRAPSVKSRRNSEQCDNDQRTAPP